MSDIRMHEEGAADTLDRFLGCLVGLAVGDALGAQVEFRARGMFPPVTEMTGGGVHGLGPGEWTDDTSMALCLAESIVETGGFDPGDQMRRYVRWYRDGHLSSTGRCFDIGTTTGGALRRFEETGYPFSGSTHARSAGNGSIMRLAPVPMRWFRDPGTAILFAGESSRTTHALPVCVDACRLMAGIVVGALEGGAKETILAPRYAPLPGLWEREPLHAEIDALARGCYKTKDRRHVHGDGYVANSLEAALWAFHQAASFEEGCLLAVNLGDDADTTAAVYGQIAGAHYGLSGIPARWVERLASRDLIEGFARSLHERAMLIPAAVPPPGVAAAASCPACEAVGTAADLAGAVGAVAVAVALAAPGEALPALWGEAVRSHRAILLPQSRFGVAARADFYRLGAPGTGGVPMVIYVGGGLEPQLYRERLRTRPDIVAAEFVRAFERQEIPAADLLVVQNPLNEDNATRESRREFLLFTVLDVLPQTPNPRPGSMGLVGYSVGAYLATGLLLDLPGARGVATIGGTGAAEAVDESPPGTVLTKRFMAYGNGDDPFAMENYGLIKTLVALGGTGDAELGEGGHDFDDYRRNGYVRDAFAFALDCAAGTTLPPA